MQLSQSSSICQRQEELIQAPARIEHRTASKATCLISEVPASSCPRIRDRGLEPSDAIQFVLQLIRLYVQIDESSEKYIILTGFLLSLRWVRHFISSVFGLNQFDFGVVLFDSVLSRFSSDSPEQCRSHKEFEERAAD